MRFIHSLRLIFMTLRESVDADPEPVLLTGERRRRIGEILGRQGRVTVNELSKLFRVTSVTIRSDLDTMASEGSLIRDRGGAIAYTSTTLAVAFEKRAVQNREQNVLITDSDLSREAQKLIRRFGIEIMLADQLASA
jgi:Mn-dependent DtxR family transcriptional regulator